MIGKFRKQSPPRRSALRSSRELSNAPKTSNDAKAKEKKKSFKEKLATFANAASFGLNALATGGGAVVVGAEIAAIEEAQCSLVIADYFEATEDGETAHGVSVRRAAETIGTPRRMVEYQLPGTYGSRVGAAKTDWGVTFGKQWFWRTELRRSFDDYVVEEYSAFLDGKTEVLEERSIRRLQNSVINFSQGMDRATVSEKIYKSLRTAWTSDDEEHRELRVQKVRNAAKLFRLDADDILSEDPEINGPERQALQQAIIDRVVRVIANDDRVEEARENFETAVDRVESRNNSVVIAGGNSREVERWLVRDNGGHALETPDNFTTNFLEIDAVTSVGAIRTVAVEGREEPVEIPARYGSESPGLDLWAEGTYEHPGDEPIMGTSFAAPRVSVTMGKVHCDNQEMISEQVEDYVAEQLGRGMQPIAKHEVVLDLELSRGLFAR